MSLKKLIEEITQPIIEDMGGIVAGDGTIKGGSKLSKIKKMNLIGAPFQIIIGKKTGDGLVEFKRPGDELSLDLPLEDVIKIIKKEKAKY